MKFPILLLAAVTLSFAQWGGGGKSINDYKRVSVSGRDVYVYAPSGVAAKSPLLLSFHGMDQDPNYQQSNTHWEAVADTAGFVVAYPKGATGYSTWDISGDKDTSGLPKLLASSPRTTTSIPSASTCRASRWAACSATMRWARLQTKLLRSPPAPAT